jgi:hypothetical protein
MGSYATTRGSYALASGLLTCSPVKKAREARALPARHRLVTIRHTIGTALSGSVAHLATTITAMSSLAHKIRAEHRMRELLISADLPQPDAVEYGDACVRFFFEPQKVCVVVDIDDHEADSS